LPLIDRSDHCPCGECSIVPVTSTITSMPSASHKNSRVAGDRRLSICDRLLELLLACNYPDFFDTSHPIGLLGRRQRPVRNGNESHSFRIPEDLEG
jgi:hypothetical protein